MSVPERRRFTDAAAARLQRHPLLLPLIVVLLGAVFRFYNLNWDGGHQLHPDERWIFMVVSGSTPESNGPLAWPHSWAQFFDIRGNHLGSPLHPHFFAYGSLPFYLLALVSGAIAFAAAHLPFLSQWNTVDTYGGLPDLGRALSAALDLTSVVLVFLIGRRIYGFWTGVLAMAFTAFTVLNVQLSHFYAVDTVLLPLVLLTLLASIIIVQTNSRTAYLWGGLVFGAALATKTTALLLVIPLGVAAAFSAWSAAPWQGGARLQDGLIRHYTRIRGALNSNLRWLLLTYVVAAVTFVVCEPYAVLDRAKLVHDIAEQSNILVTNTPPFAVPYTIQYAHTIPYVYQLQNLLFWGMGIPLAVVAFLGVLACLFRNAMTRVRGEEIVLILWIVPYFLFVGRFLAKFDRYMLPITPLMTLLGAAALVHLARSRRRPQAALGRLAISATVLVSVLYSVAYTNIYMHPNTRVAASNWIYQHIPAGTKIAVETPWDDPLPLDMGTHSPLQYHPINLDLYQADTSAKVANISDALVHARYLIMSSERMVRSIPRLPDRYPLTTRYYQLLLGERLNFRLIKHFEEHPALGPITVQDYGADESFHVYDHPDVRIYERIRTTTPARVAALLGFRGDSAAAPGAAVPPTAVSDRRLMLSSKQWRADQTGSTMDQMFPPNGFAMHHPVLIWLLVLEMIGVIAFPLTFLLFRNLLDRGFVIAKTMGLLLVAYPVWLLARLGLAEFDLSLIWLITALLAVAALVLAYHLRVSLIIFVRAQWKSILLGEAVFLAGFALFVLLRMWYPDLGHQFSPVSPSNVGSGRMGEKQMELAFLNGVVRSRVFPPLDPFFAHGYINYYYYGYVLVGLLCKITQIAPSVGFNLAVATFFAMLVATMSSVAVSLTRRLMPGVFAAVFVGLLGNLNGAVQAVNGLMSIATVRSHVPVLGGIANTASGLWQAVIRHQALPPFDYWEPTRIVPPANQAITEFPYFTYLFADLHAHLIAYPLTAAVLALSVSFALGTSTRLTYKLLAMAMGALILGALAVTNPWDYPTYLLVLGIGSLTGLYALKRRFVWHELFERAAWLGALALASIALYVPFKFDYQTVFPSGLGVVRDITPQVLAAAGMAPGQVREALVTPLPIYLEHFGFFLFVILSFLTGLLLWDVGFAARAHRWALRARFVLYYREHPGRLLHAGRVACGLAQPPPALLDTSVLAGFSILVIGLFLLHFALLAFLAFTLGLVILLLLRLGPNLSRPNLYVLLLLVVPIGLSMGTQIFYVKDFLAGGSAFRMNTIFKFYDQAWVLFSLVAAVALHQFLTRIQSNPRWRRFPRNHGYPPTSVEKDDQLILPVGAASTVASTPLPPPGNVAYAAIERGPLLARDLTFAVADGAGQPAKASVGGAGRIARFRRAAASTLPALQRRPLWSMSFVALLAASLIYTYAGTASRQTVRDNWLPQNSVPLTLDGMAFMKVAYPQDYAGIRWLNSHVRGAPVIAEAFNRLGSEGIARPFYDWRSRVSVFTGLPSIVNGIHEGGEQRYPDQTDPRITDVDTLYTTSSTSVAGRIIRRYGVQYIFVGFSETQCASEICYPHRGIGKFKRMVGRGLAVAFQRPGVTIYRVTSL